VKSASEQRAGGAWLVYGFDEYVKTETVRMAARAFIAGADPRLAITHLVGAQTDSQEILQAAQSVPMLATHSAVIVHDLHRLAPAHKSRLTGHLASIPDTCLLICVGPEEPDRRTKLYAWFVESGRDIACDPLSPAQAEAFARRRLEELGASADAEALSRLLTLSGPDAGTIARETEKLSLYAGSQVTAHDVDVVSGLSAGYTPEDLVASLVAGRVPEAMARSRLLRRTGFDSGALIGRLCGHFFDIRRAVACGFRQSWQMAGALRVSRSRAEELQAWLKSAGANRIDLALEVLARAEALTRSGRADADLVCDQAVLAVAQAFAGHAAIAT
jgi:DNA polymerase III delta subunit